MADRLYLSYWLRGFTEGNMLERLEAVLLRFPFSRLKPHAVVSVFETELVEPPLTELEVAGSVDASVLIARCREYRAPGNCYEVAAFWDLWDLEDAGARSPEWKLRPAPAWIHCFGPGFASEFGERLRLDFGLDAKFLPPAGAGANLGPVRQNIRSLLHLVEDLDAALPVERRQLWSESGGNFADRLRSALAGEPA